ncbi:MAG: hypothetical protein QM736_02945 [Vicinamibacterales bacterium]
MVFDDTGTLRDTYRWNGTNTYESGAFSSALRLGFNGTPCCIVAGTYSDSYRELTFSPVVSESAPGILETRRLRSLHAGNLVRVLDTFTNTTTVPKTISVSLTTNPRSSSSPGVEVAPSTTTGGYIVRRDPNGQAPAFGIVYAGVDAPIAPGLAWDDGLSFFMTPVTLTVPPGQSISLLNYVVMDGPSSASAVIAEADALAAGTDPGMFDGLSREDLQTIANFKVTVPPPGPGKVRATVLDLDGNVVTGVSVALVGNGTTVVRQPYEDIVRRVRVPRRDTRSYVVQASFDTCYQSTCGVLLTEGFVSVQSDSTVSTTLSFARLGQARIEVRDENGNPMPFENVDVEIQSLAAAGPLGSYRTTFNADLDETSAVLVNHLPPGSFNVHIYAPTRDMDGAGSGTATRFSPATTVVHLSWDVLGFTSWAYSMGGVDGYYYIIGSKAALQGSFIWDGSQVLNQGALLVESELRSALDPLCCALAAFDNGTDWTFQPMPVPAAPGVTVVRRLHMASSGGFLRYYDVVTNTSASTQIVPLSLSTTLDQSRYPDVDVSPTVFTPGYFVRSDPAQGALSFASIYNGIDTPITLTPSIDADQNTVQAGVTMQLTPGQSVALLHFVLLRAPDDVAGAVTAADALGALSPPDALEGLSPDDLTLIANFRITP